MLSFKNVHDYLDVTLDQLNIALWIYENAEQAKWEVDGKETSKQRFWDKKRWLEAGWAKLGPRYLSSLGDDALPRLLRGKYKWNDEHVKTWHSVLTLDQYGLKWEDIWGPVDGTDIRYDLEAYADLLRNALSQHKDPLGLIRRHSDKAFPLKLDGPGGFMWTDLVEGGDASDPTPSDLLTQNVGDKLVFMVTPRTEGCVLLFSTLQRTGKTFIMNEVLGMPRINTHSRWEPLRFQPSIANGEPGRRDVIAINWPKTVDPERYNLAGFFARADPSVSDDEMRRFGAAIAETKKRSDEERVFARLRPLVLNPKTGP